MKKFLIALILICGIAAAPSAMANHGKMCASGASVCPMKSQSSACGKCGQVEESYPCPVINKVMKKAHFLLDNTDELNLTPEQVKTITDIKMQVKKSAIRQGSGMEIFMLDTHSKLSEDVVDVTGINAMIDQGMSEMSAATKANVESYAALKSVLTPEQLAKAKEIWKKK